MIPKPHASDEVKKGDRDVIDQTIRVVVCAALVAGLALARSADAQTELFTESFETPDVTPFGGFLPQVAGWTEEGPTNTQQGFTGKLDTGIFLNSPPTIDGHLDNITGSQALFIGARDANQPGVTEPIALHRTLGDAFVPGRTYTFSFDAAQSNNSIPNPGAELEVRFFFNGPGGRTLVANRVIGTDDVVDVNVPANQDNPLDPDSELFVNSFTPFSFDVTVAGADPWADAAIGLEIRPISGTTGFWDIDNIRVTEIPEPATAMLLGIGGLLMTRRRSS